ncbi:MAG: PA14 domain-containing protein [Verrucomicrobiales bacterium]
MSLSRQGDTYYSSWAADLNGTPGRWSAADSKTGSTADVYVGLTHHSHGYGSNSGSTNWTNTASFDSYQVGSFNAGLQGTSGTYDVGGSIQAGGLALTGNAYTYNLSDGLATGERTGWKLEIYDGDNASQGLWTEVYEHMNINNTGYWDSILNFNGEPSLTYQGADTKFGRAASGLSYDAEMAALDRFTGSGGWAAETGANEAEVYSVRQWGEIFIPENGTYNFRDGTDDYFGLIVDGQTLVDDNSAAGPNGLNSGNPTPQGSITFSDVPSGGKWVPIELRMAEGGGGDNSILFWDYLPTDPSDPSAGGTINANGDYSSSTALGAGAEVPLAFLRSPDLIDSIMGSYQIGDESTFDVFRRDDGSPVDLGAGNYLINFTSFNTGVASTSFLVPFSVPEPSRALLLALGLVGFALRRRR